MVVKTVVMWDYFEAGKMAVSSVETSDMKKVDESVVMRAVERAEMLVEQ